ncbi:MAG: glucarate dehydratase [Proteobacteria bacterium]|nr:glucarate dehydratase [Pseudomonadota bacterium]
MKIKEVRVTPIAFKDPPVLNATGVHLPYALRSIIEVEGDNGLVGLGETYGDLPILNNLRKVSGRLAGMNPFDINGLRTVVDEEIRTDLAPGFENLNPGTHAAKAGANTFGAFETAFLDLQARSIGVPLATLLGGIVRREVPYSAYLFFKYAEHQDAPYDADDWGEIMSVEALVASARRMVDRFGFKSLKLKAGALEPMHEADCILALSKAFPGLPLRIDPNANWSMPTALKVAERLNHVLEYYEDPVPKLEAMAQLHKVTGLPMATNMVVTSMAEFRENVGIDGAQVVLSDHHFWGGLLATRQLAAMCDTFGKGVSMHSNSHLGISLMAMTHVAASIPNLTYACDTHYPWNNEEVLTRRIEIKNGSVAVNDTPGLGIEIDRSALNRLHRQYLECGLTSTSAQGDYMRRWQPDFSSKQPRY